MKLFHLSDLHIGVKINGFSMLEDQKYILNEILSAADTENPDAVIIAGDIYDKAIPPADAVCLFDDFLCALSERGIKAFIISGNHDSAERLSFGGRLMNTSGIYFSPIYDGNVHPITLTDQYGDMNIYLFPFVKPSHVKACFPDEEIATYTDAVRTAISHMDIDETKRNVIVSHQFFIGTSQIDPDTEFVDYSVLSPFDYAALGHIHTAQKVGCDTVRFCGTPIKYSFSECGNQNSITVVEMSEKNRVEIRTIGLIPQRDWREIKGTYMELTARKFYETFSTNDYIHAILTDEEDIPDAISKLRIIYPNIMHLSYDNRRTKSGVDIMPASDDKQKSPFELFAEFYELQNNQPLTDIQSDFIKSTMDKIREDSL